MENDEQAVVAENAENVEASALDDKKVEETEVANKVEDSSALVAANEEAAAENAQAE